MNQAGSLRFAPAQTPEAGLRLVGASLALTRLAAGQWAKLFEEQFAFTRDVIGAALDGLSRAGADDPRHALLDWQMATGRRLVDLGLRHLQRTGELIFEGQRELLAQLGTLAGEPAAKVGADAVAEQAGTETAAEDTAPGSEVAAAGEEHAGEGSETGTAAEGRRRAPRREASAA